MKIFFVTKYQRNWVIGIFTLVASMESASPWIQLFLNLSLFERLNFSRMFDCWQSLVPMGLFTFYNTIQRFAILILLAAYLLLCQSSNELNSTSSNGQQKVSASTGKVSLRFILDFDI